MAPRDEETEIGWKAWRNDPSVVYHDGLREAAHGWENWLKGGGKESQAEGDAVDFLLIVIEAEACTPPHLCYQSA
jgi:hypothetical protein